MAKLWRLVAMVAWLLLGWPAAHAALLLSLVPREASVSAPGNVQVDVVLSGLSTSGAPVAAFDLTLTYRADLLQWLAIGSRLGSGLGDPFDAGQTIAGADNSVAGALSLYEVSLLEGSATGCLVCSGPYLDVLQGGDKLVLAELLFYAPHALGNGAVATFAFSNNPGAVIVGDANGQRLGDIALRDGSVAVVPEPASLLLVASALLAMGAVHRCATRRRKPWRCSAVLLLAVTGTAHAASAAGPMPDGNTGSGPMTLTIRSTAPVQSFFRITQGNTGGCFGSLSPLLVQESAPRNCADFRVGTAQAVTITLRSDPAQGASYTQAFTFTPGLYHIGAQFNLHLTGDDADFWIQKYNASTGLFEFVFQHTIEVDTQGKLFITSGDGDGVLQSVVNDVTTTTVKTLAIPGGAATYAKNELFPATVHCPSTGTPPVPSCPSIAHTITAGNYGEVSLAYASVVGQPPVSRTVSTPYDQLVFSAPSSSTLTVAHTRLAFVPPGPPTLDAIANPAPIVVKDGQRTLVLQGITDGGDGSQRLTLSASSSNPSLVPSPTIAYRAGERVALLNFRADPGAAGLSGEATVTVTLQDDGGTPNYPADDSAVKRSFAVRVLAARPCEGAPCLAYTSHRDHGVVDIIDIASNTRVGSLEGAAPVSLLNSADLAVSADGRRIYVPARIGNDGALAVFDGATARQVAVLPLPAQATALGLSIDGRTLFVLTADLLVVVDTAAGMVAQTVSLGAGFFADGLVFGPDGRRVYVTGQVGRLLAIDTGTRQIAGSALIPPGHHGAVMAVDGAKIYVSNTDADSVWVIDPGSLQPQTIVAVGHRPQVPAVTPDGMSLVVPVFDQAFHGRLDLFSTSSHLPVGRIDLGGLNGPQRVLVTGDGTRAYVNFETDRSVVAVALATRRMVASIPIGTPTIGLAMGQLPPFKRLLGDIQRDGEIDQRDLSLLLVERNTPAVGSTCGLACDLDGDGLITVLDARLLAGRCTRPGCAQR